MLPIELYAYSTYLVLCNFKMHVPVELCIEIYEVFGFAIFSLDDQTGGGRAATSWNAGGYLSADQEHYGTVRCGRDH